MLLIPPRTMVHWIVASTLNMKADCFKADFLSDTVIEHIYFKRSKEQQQQIKSVSSIKIIQANIAFLKLSRYRYFFFLI